MNDCNEIKNLIDNLLKNMLDRNLDETLNLFKKDAIGIGTGGEEIVSTYEDHIEHFELSFVMDTIQIENFKIIGLKVVGDIAWSLFSLDMKVIHENQTMYDGNFRFSLVSERENGRWKISQHHASVPQIGTDDIKGMPTREGIKDKIEELLVEFELYSDVSESIDSKNLKQYLLKAKDIAMGLQI